MKSHLLKLSFALTALVALTAQAAEARQYIQCAYADTFDRMVVNLDGERSTLFLTDGVHNPDEIRILKKLQEVQGTATHAVFQTLPLNSADDVQETVTIAREFVGVANPDFDLELTMTQRSTGRSQTFEFNCFSALYEE